MNSRIMFSSEELELLSNNHLFVLKAGLLKKISALFGELSDELGLEMLDFKNSIPEEVLHSQPKISRGENYKGFPWMVLDFPRVFKKEDVFAYRCLCWWGNEFSFTLHLGGIYFDTLRPILNEFLASINIPGIYICVNDSPWNYHYEIENYLPLSEFIKMEKNLTPWFSNRKFIKISKKTTLDNYTSLIKDGRTFLGLMLKEMSNK